MVTKILFVYAFEKVISYIDRIVRCPREEEGVAEVIADFHPSAVRRHVLGKGGWERLEEILAEYRASGERILITADGFDAMVGYFSLASDRIAEARRFEREILLTLFQVVLNRGPARIGGGRLYEISDYCIAVPHDRFTDARAWDRDTFQYRNRVAPIRWSGVELSALVRKRLALLRSVPDPKGPVLEERLAQVMKKGFPELPDEVAFLFGAANYRIPIFLYVLRHTLWRPRDVMYYYATLLAASDEFRKKKVEAPSSFLRQIIAGATHQIVKDELLAEYASTFRNLREVLHVFRQAPQIVSWLELEARLDRMRFDTDLRPDEVPTLEWKVELLYELGVLGVILDRKRSERFSAYKHAFIFNEDHLLTDKLGRDNYRDCDFALHPVLCEYLNLDTSRNSELILPLDWDYLHPNEVLRKVRPV